MACNITIKIGENKDSSIEVKTLPNYRFKIDYVISNSPPILSHRGPPYINIVYFYYCNNQFVPLTKISGGVFPIGRELVDTNIRLYMKNMKDKVSMTNGVIQWDSNTNIWTHGLSSKFFTNSLEFSNNVRLLLNEESINQFVNELEGICIFYELINYKIKILHPQLLAM